MKRLILSFAVLCLLVFYNWYSEKYITDFCNKLDTYLETCAQEIKEKKYPQALATASKLLDEWEKRDIFLGVITGDSTVAESQIKILVIYRGLIDEQYNECLMTIRECQGCIHEIKEDHRTNLGNVL